MKVKAFLQSFLTSLIIFSLMFYSLGNVLADNGAVWTTTSSCGAPQNANQYISGNTVYIHGDNFDAGDYNWNITGQPGSSDPNIIVAFGSITIDGTGEFCFAAYIIQNGDNGVYKAEVDNKFDNYSVRDVSATATPVPTITPNPTSIPTPTPTVVPTSTPTSTPDPTTTPTIEPTITPAITPTPTATVTPTDSPTITPSPTPGVLGDTTDICANIDGIQTTVPADHHLDASGLNCVQFAQSGPPSNSGTSGGQVLGTSTTSATGTGQVLGASTLGATGTEQQLMLMLYIVGGITISSGVGMLSFSKREAV